VRTYAGALCDDYEKIAPGVEVWETRKCNALNPDFWG